MSSQSIIIKTFNDHFEEFLDDLCVLFPDDTEIKTLNVNIKRLRSANPTISIKAFESYVSKKYREQIVSNDLGFFIQKDYTSDLVNTNMTSRIMTKINELREPIGELQIESQDKVMKYLNNLLKLSDLYKK